MYSHASCLVYTSTEDSNSAGAPGKQVESEACCRFGEWNLKDVDFLNQVQLITAKPVVYLVNLPEKMYIKKKSKWLPKVATSTAYLTADPEWHTTLLICTAQSLMKSCSALLCAAVRLMSSLQCVSPHITAASRRELGMTLSLIVYTMRLYGIMHEQSVCMPCCRSSSG